MKHINIFFTFLFFSFYSFSQINSYTFKRKLDSVGVDGYYSIPLSPEITSKSKSSLNDLRLYQIRENDTIEVPYLINYKGDKVENKESFFELINTVSNLKCCSFVTLKMNKRRIINTIYFDIEQSNFDKNITVEGSNNNKDWYVIKTHLRITGFYNNSINFKSTSIDFPNAEYEYFRIKLDDDASEKVVIHKAVAYESSVNNGEYDKLVVLSKKQTNNKETKTSETVINYGANQIINYIKINCVNKENFYRNINIYKSIGTFPTAKGKEEAWQLISTGILASDRENKFNLNNSQTTKLKIEVINYDNQPIEITDVEAYSEKIELISKLPLNGLVYLAYGKENEKAPVYDLVHFKSKIPENLNSIKLGKEETKIEKLEKKSALIENKIWLWVALGSLVLLIGYFALKMLKNEQSKD